MNEKFRITEFYSVLKTQNKTGESFFMRERYASAFIIIFSGQVRFTDTAGNCLLCDNRHPVYLPQGLSYRNECLSVADARIFNFFDNGAQPTPLSLTPIDKTTVKDYFDRSERILYPQQRQALERMSILYALAALLCAPDEPALPPIVVQAVRLMTVHLADPRLQIARIAAQIPVSEVYLRRLFWHYFGCSPYRYLTKLRMEKAKTYLLENRTVTETGTLCGYSDVYTFSRAFKQYYGHSPKG